MDKQDLPLPLCILMGITKQSPATQNLLSCSPQSYDPMKLNYLSPLPSPQSEGIVTGHVIMTLPNRRLGM